MLEETTPLLLTFNEERNIGRTLSRLQWAGEIVVVDSFSTDSTLDVLRGDSRVRVFQRRFDSHANQWNYALKETGIRTDWVLAMDADYLLTEELIGELRQLRPGSDIAGFRAAFTYCIEGKKLWGSLYPPGIVLFRRNRGGYVQDGHTQKLRLDGQVLDLKGRILHDDRKPLSQWVEAQIGYAELEARKLLSERISALSWPDRTRRLIVFAPWVTLFYCLILKGCLLQGRKGLYYSFQRTLAELLLSLELLSRVAKK